MIRDLDERFHEAIQAFWDTRRHQQQKQLEGGKVDAGSRGAVTGGAQMGMLERLFADIIVDAGAYPDSVRIGERLDLPGYYRPEKQWDLLVVDQDQLVLAMEFKSQVGSFGNNFNNRTEEALGTSEDIWTAYREERFGQHAAPFVGYFFLLQDTPRVHAPVRVAQSNFPVDKVFREASYAARYKILCERLVLERKYSAVCLTLATQETSTKISFPSEDLSFRRFAARVEAHVRLHFT